MSFSAVARSIAYRNTIRRIVLLVLALIALAFTPVGRWALVPRANQIDSALDERLTDVHFENVSLVEALGRLGQQAGVEIEVDWKSMPSGRSGALRSEIVTARLRDVTLREAIDAVLRATQADAPPDPVLVELSQSRIKIYSQSAMTAAAASTRIYDLRPLIGQDISTFPRSMRLKSNGGLVYFDDTANQLAELYGEAIRNRFYGSAYRRVPAGIDFYGQLDAQILVCETPENHRRIRALLDGLSSPLPLRSGSPTPRTTLPAGVSSSASTRVDVHFDNVLCSEAIRRIAEQAQLNIAMSTDQNGPTDERRITLDLFEVTPRQAMRSITNLALDANHYPRYRAVIQDADSGVTARNSDDDGAFVDAGYDGQMSTRVYDVRDMLRALASDPMTSAIGLRDGNAMSAAPLARSQAFLEEIIDEELGSQDIFASTGYESFRLISGRLIVRLARVKHADFARWLRDVHRQITQPMDASVQRDVIRRREVSSDGVLDVALEQQGFEHGYSQPDGRMQVISELDLDGVQFKQAIDRVRRFSDNAIYVNEQPLIDAGVDMSKSIRLRVKDVSVSAALQIILDAVSAPDAVSVEYGMLGTKRCFVVSAPRRFPIQIYDIHDLITSYRLTPTVSRPAMTQPYVGPTMPIARRSTLQCLAAMVHEQLQFSDEVSRDYGGKVRIIAGRLAVSTSRANHRRVVELLDELRLPKSPAAKRLLELISESAAEAALRQL